MTDIEQCKNLLDTTDINDATHIFRTLTEIGINVRHVYNKQLITLTGNTNRDYNITVV